MNIFRRKPAGYYDCEFDIERMPVFSIERQGELTVIGYGLNEVWEMRCHPAKHGEFVARLRSKLNASIGTSVAHFRA